MSDTTNTLDPATMTAWQDEHVHMVVDVERSLLSVTWKDYPTSAHYRTMLEHMLTWIDRFKLKYFLTDQRQRGAILLADEQFLITEWAPRITSSSVVRSAVVMGNDFFNRMTIDHLVERGVRPTGLEVQYFSDPAAAEAWLLEGAAT